jgi:hypothetical protein
MHIHNYKPIFKTTKEDLGDIVVEKGERQYFECKKCKKRKQKLNIIDNLIDEMRYNYFLFKYRRF